MRHMKWHRGFMLFTAVLAALLLLAGCGVQPTDFMQKPTESADTAASEPPASAAQAAPVETEDGTFYTKEFGTYTVPTGWVEADKYSTDSKFFYVVDGTEEEPQPNNISVESGKNKYLAKDHEQFRTAILNQILMQIKGTKAALNGAGTYTKDNGYNLYIFTITEDETDVVTNQYYIVGDYRYVLVQETTFADAEDADKAAQTIVDGFTWAA